MSEGDTGGERRVFLVNGVCRSAPAKPMPPFSSVSMFQYKLSEEEFSSALKITYRPAERRAYVNGKPAEDYRPPTQEEKENLYG